MFSDDRSADAETRKPAVGWYQPSDVTLSIHHRRARKFNTFTFDTAASDRRNVQYRMAKRPNRYIIARINAHITVIICVFPVQLWARAVYEKSNKKSIS